MSRKASECVALLDKVPAIVVIFALMEVISAVSWFARFTADATRWAVVFAIFCSSSRRTKAESRRFFITETSSVETFSNVWKPEKFANNPAIKGIWERKEEGEKGGGGEKKKPRKKTGK